MQSYCPILRQPLSVDADAEKYTRAMLPCALSGYRQTCSHRGNDFDQSIIRSYVELNQVLVGRDIAQ